MIVKDYSNNTSEDNEDIEILIKSLINSKGIEESKLFDDANEYESLK